MSGLATIYEPIRGERREKMLFMTITSWQPEKADAVGKRAAQKLSLTAGKIIGQWTAIEGGRAFRVVEVDDPKGAAAVCAAWNDICEMEVIPIMTSEDYVKAVATKK
jgi:hypothetical protein